MKKQRTAEEIEQVLLEFDASGQSVREYGEKAGMAPRCASTDAQSSYLPYRGATTRELQAYHPTWVAKASFSAYVFGKMGIIQHVALNGGCIGFYRRIATY